MMLVEKIILPIIDNCSFIWIIYSLKNNTTHRQLFIWIICSLKEKIPSMLLKKITTYVNNYLFEVFESFELMWLNIYSFNSLCEKYFNILSNLMNLFLGGFNAAFRLFFNWTMRALLVLSFFEWYIFLLSWSNIVNEILELFILNSVNEILNSVNEIVIFFKCF